MAIDRNALPVNVDATYPDTGDPSRALHQQAHDTIHAAVRDDTTPFSHRLTRTAVKTANYTAAVGDLVPCDTTSAAFTVTLPTGPAVGSRVAVKLVTLGAGHAVTIACGGTDVFNKTGGPTTGTLTLLNQALQVQYDTGGIWTVVADDLPKSALDAIYAPLASPALTGTPTVNGATVEDRTHTAATFAALVDVRDTEQVKARAMTAWFSALALRDTTPAKVAILGDSVTEGRGASANPPASDPRYVGKLLARIRNRFPPATPVVGGLGYIPVFYAGSGMTSPWAVANGPSQSLNQGLGLRSYALANASHSLTITVVGTSCDLHYLKGSTSRIMGYQVDGGTVNTIETNGGTVTDNGILRITLGAAGSHTLKLTWSSGGSVFPEGIYVYNGDENTGVQLYEGGHSSYRVSDLIAQQTNVVTRLNAIGPALVVIEFGINEYNTSVPSATFRTNLQTLIAGIRSTVTSAPSIVLVGYPDNSSPPYAEPWANYVQALYDVAAADTGGLGGASGVTVCDLSKRLPATSVSTYSLWADTFHPNDKGHATIADALLAFISPR